MSGIDRYLLAVYIETQRDGAPVSSGAVADLLDTSTPSVTEMLQRLDGEGLVTYEAYNGATLTDDGQERAAELHDSYVTLSWFFRSVLELEGYESEAMRLAEVIDPSVAERLTTTLPVEHEE